MQTNSKTIIIMAAYPILSENSHVLLAPVVYNEQFESQ